MTKMEILEPIRCTPGSNAGDSRPSPSRVMPREKQTGRHSFVQPPCAKSKIIKPGEKITVHLKGPGAEFDLEFDNAIFGEPAKRESKGYWKSKECAEEVIIPDVDRF